MPMPSVPFAYLVLCQAELLLGRLEARLNLPARARHPHHLLQRGGLLGGENHVVSELVNHIKLSPCFPSQRMRQTKSQAKSQVAQQIDRPACYSNVYPRSGGTCVELRSNFASRQDPLIPVSKHCLRYLVVCAPLTILLNYVVRHESGSQLCLFSTFQTYQAHR